MKTHNLLILVLIAFCSFACKEDDSPKTEVPNISAAGDLSGTIDDYVSGEIDSIQVFGPNYSIVGSCNVTKTGGFSLKLTTPNTDPMLVRNYLPTEFEGQVDDEEALVYHAYILCYKGGNIIGRLVKCNYPFNQPSHGVGISTNGYQTSAMFDKVGSAYSDLVYCTAPVTISGNAVIEVSGPVTSGFYMNRDIYRFNFSLLKGWNEIQIQFTQYSLSKPAYVFNVSYSNMTTCSIQWHLFKSRNS